MDLKANDCDTAVIITRRDAPDAVIMSLDHYNSLLETVHLLNSPSNAAHLARSIAQLRSGQAKRQQLITDEISDEERPVRP